MTNNNKNQPPVQTFRDGAVSIKLWEQGRDKRFVTATVGRSYKNAEGQFKETRSFGDTDLLKLQAQAPQQHPVQQAPSQNDLVAQRDAAMNAASPSHSPQYTPNHELTR